MPKVLISDKMSQRAAEIFAERGVEVDVRPGMTPQELVDCIGSYDGLAIRSSSKVTAEVLKAAPNLKVVGRAGIGVDNVDVPAATARGVVVMNTPLGNAITTAEHAISLMLSISRDIPAASASTHAGKWEKSKFMGVEVTGKVLGIIGCGNIGALVAERAQGLKMRVIVHDPFLSDESAEKLAVEKVELDDLLARSDFISIHTPLTDTTRGMIDSKALAECKKGVRIVNCARGGIVVEADLRAAVESGHVAGAAVDVYSVEPAKENVLFGLDRIVCTPHLGASTREAQENVAIQIAEQMAEYLVTGAVTNALNMPSVTTEEARKLGSYMKLVEQLGSFAGQLIESGIKSVTIQYEGLAADLNTKPLTALALKALLAPQLETVNMVSAPVIAKQRGIAVSETRTDQTPDFHTLVRLVVETEDGVRQVAGSLFGGHRPRVVAIDDMPIEAELAGNMLFVRNADKPGLIGNLGRTLADAGINIANFHLGRFPETGEAICFVSIDSHIDEALLSKITDLPNVLQAKVLVF
ncbi:MAG: phosphoglycerate dehydrogenase [Pseudomonadota bacterium]|nr:phosphoglycerate dehydrogenase [Pseudomonadota bacterium]